MIDLYLKAADKAAMNEALIAAGLAFDDEEHGLQPALGVSLDVIGSIPGSDHWHVNVRCAGLSEEAEAEIEDVKIVPPETPFRVWA